MWSPRLFSEDPHAHPLVEGSKKFNSTKQLVQLQSDTGLVNKRGKKLRGVGKGRGTEGKEKKEKE